jgi:uncharacterized protein
MTLLFHMMIRIYRTAVSPVLAGLGCRCRFHPSCSAYATDALRLHPWPRAMRLAAWRIVKCGPWNPGGVDPVPRPL